MFKNIFHCKFYLIHQIFVYIFIINVTICTLEIEKERVKARESYDNKKKKKQWMTQHKNISKDHSTQKHRVIKKGAKKHQCEN